MGGLDLGHERKLFELHVHRRARTGLWAYAVNGTNATIGGIGVLSGGDIVYSGAFSGSTDLGNGTVQSATGGAQVSLFVVRRSP